MSNANTFADISSNNGGFEPKWYASSGHKVIAIKATEGAGFTNPEYTKWVQEAHAHGLSVIHYGFARPEAGHPREQARHLWDTVQEHFRRPGDYIFWDVETGGPQLAAGWLREADSYLSSISGTHGGCYTPLSYYQESAITIASKRFWIAAWGNNRPGNRSWKLPRNGQLWAWQASGGTGITGGGVPLEFAGIPGRCDGSLLNPTVARYFNRLRHK